MHACSGVARDEQKWRNKQSDAFFTAFNSYLALDVTAAFHKNRINQINSKEFPGAAAS